MNEEYIESLFELTPTQKWAFAKLEKAFADCRKSGLKLYNCYGTLGCFDSKKIKEYTFQSDAEGAFIPALDANKFTNTFDMGFSEFCDDEIIHCFVPAKKIPDNY